VSHKSGYRFWEIARLLVGKLKRHVKTLVAGEQAKEPRKKTRVNKKIEHGFESKIK